MLTALELHDIHVAEADRAYAFAESCRKKNRLREMAFWIRIYHQKHVDAQGALNEPKVLRNVEARLVSLGVSLRGIDDAAHMHATTSAGINHGQKAARGNRTSNCSE
ncbi:MAG: hypothetical protein JSR78_09140 [Proteobacteria bacterium]|nr:hypothetical protein [Pseudomonadota bacterium]